MIEGWSEGSPILDERNRPLTSRFAAAASGLPSPRQGETRSWLLSVFDSSAVSAASRPADRRGFVREIRPRCQVPVRRHLVHESPETKAGFAFPAT